MKPEEVERSFARGQKILARGATDRALYIVRSGAVQIDAGDGRPPRRLAGGALFGEISAILGQPSPYAAVADEDAVVLVLDVPLLNRMCRESPEFSMRLVHHLALECLQAVQDTVPGSYGEAPEDLASLCRALLRRRASAGGGGAIPGALRDLAEDAGLSLMEAYLALHALLERGWVQLSEDQLSILSPDALEALVR